LHCDSQDGDKVTVSNVVDKTPYCIRLIHLRRFFYKKIIVWPDGRGRILFRLIVEVFVCWLLITLSVNNTENNRRPKNETLLAMRKVINGFIFVCRNSLIPANISNKIMSIIKVILTKSYWQSGFTAGRSTMDAKLALRLLAELHRNFNRQLNWRGIAYILILYRKKLYTVYLKLYKLKL